MQQTESIILSGLTQMKDICPIQTKLCKSEEE